MAEFPLLPIPNPASDRRPSGPRGGGNLHLPGRARQGERLGPVFQRLRNVFEDRRDPVTLREDSAGIAPERALVLDVAGTVDDFYRAAQNIEGLEYLGDEETEFEAGEDFAESDKRKDREGEYRTDRPVGGRLYLAMPDTGALRQLLSLWDRYQRDEQPPNGFAPWFRLFDRLRELRGWGPQDRIPETTTDWLTDELEAGRDPVRVEIELWSRPAAELLRRLPDRLEHALNAVGGEILHWASIPEIAYRAALVDLPAAEARRLHQREESPLAICDDAMLILPQSTTGFPTAVDTLGPGGSVEPAPAPELPPIAALLDGVPVLGHRLLDGRVTFDDADDLEPLSVISERRHGTEMASLILHGDRNLSEPALPRRLYVRPVLYAPGDGADERPHPDRLLLDTIYRAVVRMKDGDVEGDATAPGVFLVNLSLGDRNRPFTRPMSPWGRLLDHLADRFRILFLVSAGQRLGTPTDTCVERNDRVGGGHRRRAGARDLRSARRAALSTNPALASRSAQRRDSRRLARRRSGHGWRLGLDVRTLHRRTWSEHHVSHGARSPQGHQA